MWPRQSDSAFAAARAAAAGERRAVRRELGDRSGLASALQWLGHTIGAPPEDNPPPNAWRRRRCGGRAWRSSGGRGRQGRRRAAVHARVAARSGLRTTRGVTSSRPWRSGARRHPGDTSRWRCCTWGRWRCLRATSPRRGLTSPGGPAPLPRRRQRPRQATLAVWASLAWRGGTRPAPAPSSRRPWTWPAGPGAPPSSPARSPGRRAWRGAATSPGARGLYGEGLARSPAPGQPLPDALGMARALVRCLVGLAGVEAAKEGRRAAAPDGRGERPLASVGRQLEPPTPPTTRPGSRSTGRPSAKPASRAAFGAGRALSPPQALAEALHVAGTAAPGPPGPERPAPASAGRSAPGWRRARPTWPAWSARAGPTGRSPAPCA